jgi:acetyl-CoA carboxylase biotin carboxyl carrier protein
MALVDVSAPMSGTVNEILVGKGDRVTAGQEVLILESMKMEIPVESPVSGVVAEVVVGAPQPVDEGAVLMRIEA